MEHPDVIVSLIVEQQRAHEQEIAASRVVSATRPVGRLAALASSLSGAGGGRFWEPARRAG